MRYFSYNMMYYRISKSEKKSIFWEKNRPGVGSDLKLTENAVIYRYNFFLSDCHFSLILLEGEVTSPYCQGPA